MTATILMMRCDRKVDLELARELRRRGHVVYATAVQLGTVGLLQAIGVRVDVVNLGNWDTVKAFMGRLQSDNAVVDVVINNIDLGGERSPLPAESLQQQFDTDMVAAFAILNLFGFSSGGLKRVANIIRAPDGASFGLGSRFNAGAKLLRKLCQAQRETLGPFGVEVTALQVSGAPGPAASRKDEAAAAESRRVYWQQVADAILALDAPALSKIDGIALLPTMFHYRPKLVS